MLIVTLLPAVGYIVGNAVPGSNALPLLSVGGMLAC